MAKLLHPLPRFMPRAPETQLVQYVEYLKTERRILRSKLPERITSKGVQAM